MTSLEISYAGVCCYDYCIAELDLHNVDYFTARAVKEAAAERERAVAEQWKANVLEVITSRHNGNHDPILPKLQELIDNG